MKPSGSAAETLAEVFRCARPELVRLGAFILGDRPAAEDVVQDVFLRMTGGISATANDRTFFAAAFSAKNCPVQAGVGGISFAAHETRFFTFTINGQGRAGRLTMVGPPVSGIVGPIAVSPDGSRIAFNAADGNFVGPGGACAGGDPEGAAISVIDLATGEIRTWQALEMPPAPAGTGVTPHELSWMADGRTLAVSYVWPASPSGPQLSMAVAALDTTSGGGSLQAHSHVLWSQPQKCVFCVEEALISPDGKSLAASPDEPGPADPQRSPRHQAHCRR